MNNTSIKKYIIAGVLVVAFILYFVFKGSGTPQALVPNPPVVSNPDGSSTSTIAQGTSTTPQGPTPTPTPALKPTPAPSGQYKDGTYSGVVADAFYGNLQVAAVIKNGKLADVQFLQYPNDNGHSQEVSGFSLPQLKQEAIAVQSANVATVSGATQTSAAFQQSLGSALVKAKA